MSNLYTITPASIGTGRNIAFNPDLASLRDLERGQAIAKALCALYIRESMAWRLPVRRAAWWTLLFDAGFTARRVYRPQPIDVWELDGEQMPLYRALKVARAMQAQEVAS